MKLCSYSKRQTESIWLMKKHFKCMNMCLPFILFLSSCFYSRLAVDTKKVWFTFRRSHCWTINCRIWSISSYIFRIQSTSPSWYTYEGCYTDDISIEIPTTRNWYFCDGLLRFTCVRLSSMKILIDFTKSSWSICSMFVFVFTYKWQILDAILFGWRSHSNFVIF